MISVSAAAVAVRRACCRLSGDSRAAEDSRAAAHLLEDWLAAGR